MSKKAWLDVLLQLLKICVVNRITPRAFKASPVPYNPDATFPDIKTDPLISNVIINLFIFVSREFVYFKFIQIYGIGERILLTWLNYCYANYKDKIWTSSDRGGAPPTRWIVNFDVDLTDSLALGAVLGAYCPFIVS